MNTLPYDKAARRISFRVCVPFLACIPVLFSCNALAESLMDQLRDKQDGWLDGSDYVLNNSSGFLPIPIIITEPAVEGGLGLAAAFFHPPDDYDADAEGLGLKANQNASDEDEFVLPDVSVVAAGVTGNDSWFVGGGHIAHWKDDRIRFEGVVGYASINLKFYGVAEGPEIDRGIKFNADGFFIDAPIAFRWRDSNMFFGGGYSFTSLQTSTDLSNILPPGLQGPQFSRLEMDTTLSALQAFVQYDSRDNTFTPNTGFDGELSVARNDEAIGSDWDFTRIGAQGRTYWSFGDMVLGLRGDFDQVNGEVPFFALPDITLRGIPALRYQGENTLVGEIELRWAFHPRISAVGFLGAGKAARSLQDMNDQPSRVTQGAGIRYFAARKLGLHAGIDVAKGPEDTYWYLTIGTAW